MTKTQSKLSTLSQEKLAHIANSLKKRIHTKREIVKKLEQAIKIVFPNSSCNIYLIDKKNKTIKYHLFSKLPWTLTEEDKKWALTKLQNTSQKDIPNTYKYIYFDRTKTKEINKRQLEVDRNQYNFNCNDGIFIALITEDKQIQALIFIHFWNCKKSLKDTHHIESSIKALEESLIQSTEAIENLSIHKKIENLLLDKIKLKERIEKDEEDLKQRILELSTLHDTSNSLSYTLNYKQIVQIITKAIGKVLGYDICSIFLWDFSPNGEVLAHQNKPLSEKLIDIVKQNVLESIQPFRPLSKPHKNVNIYIEKHYDPTDKAIKNEKLRSFANVPLIFKEEVIGLLNICSTQENAFTRNEVTFIHTMANQLASNLGRLKMVKELEKSKVGSIVESMSDGVIMLDENHLIEIINPSAKDILNFTELDSSNHNIINTLENLNLISTYKTVLKTKIPHLNQKIVKDTKSFLVSLSPVTNHETGKFGTVFVFRDNTESDRLDQIKTQRLEIINKVNLVIKSIDNLDQLLSILQEFILNIANSEMGSIQLKQDDGKYISRVHSNFPDKVRKEFKFKNGKTISEYVKETKENFYVHNYSENEELETNTKILIESYLCIPILVQNELIGLVNIARKIENEKPKISSEDIKTLTLITNLSGTAIQNAILYKKALIKEKLDQELKVANQIQKKLLPNKLPQLESIDFGASSFPARDIGGDYYDFFQLESGKIGIVIADIVGKGIPAGLFMAMLKSTLHTNITQYDSPKKALEHINKLLYKDAVINKFVPVIYCILDPETQEFTYCNAGHEPGLILKKNKFSLLDTDGFPLGGMEDTEYEEKKIILEDHDAVLLFTDGLIEARGKNNNDYGISRLKSFLKSNISDTAENIINNLKLEIDKFSIESEQHDDLTMILVKSISKNKRQLFLSPIKIQEFQVNSDKEQIPIIRKKVHAFCKNIGFTDSEIFDIKLAVNEAHANIIEHAYSGSNKGMILFNLSNFKDRIEITIKDFAKNTSKTIKGEEKDLKDLEGSGLGVYLINTLIDYVSIKKEKTFTELTFVKYKNVSKKKGATHGSN